MGKHDNILFLAYAIGVSEEEFTEAASKLDLESLSVSQIMDKVSTHITINRIKRKLKVVMNSMPIVIFALIVATVYMAGGH